MKRLISVILTLVMILSLITVVPVHAATALTDNEITSKVQNYLSIVGSKRYWNANITSTSTLKAQVDANNYLGATEKEACVCSGKHIRANGCTSNNFTGVSKGVAQCWGFADYIEYVIFKTTDGSNWTKHNSVSENFEFRPGDLIHYYRKSSGTYHTIVVYKVSGSTAYIIEGNWDGKCHINQRTLSTATLRSYTGANSKSYVMTPPSTLRVSSSIPEEPETHKHSDSKGIESDHPHLEFIKCSSCGRKAYTGAKELIKSCQKCYPVGNVKLTRSFEKAKRTATFYRNNVSNATSYTLKLYHDGSFYAQYTMSSDEKTITGLSSGNYTATLYAKNSNTGEERSDSCESFKIVETYTVSYNANGGSNAPSSHEKLQDDSDFTLKTQAPTKAHYVFKGWARSKNATVAEYQPGDTYNRNAKATLYAVWEPETYTIKFDANGGKGEIADTTITYGDAIRIPNDVICDYSYLKGWSTSKIATTATYKVGMDYKFDANTTLYAVWGTSTWTGGVSTSLSGSGTELDPYLISSEADLGYLANKVNSQTTAPEYEYYKLTNNINLAYNEWVPIGLYGNEYQYFYGSFDGNGFTISDLYITKENEKNVGLFGYVKESEIKNLTVTGAIESITSSNALNIGAIVGYAENTTLKELNTMYFNIGSISIGTTDYTRMGTIAGYVSGGSVSDCISTDSHIDLKSGKFEAGMIAGYSDADITDCSAKATTGGLFSTQTTVGEFRLGGLCGNLSANAERCSVYATYLSNNIKTTAASSVGGLVGYLDGEVKVCSSQFSDDAANSITINGTGSTEIGGIAGFATSNAKIIDSKFDGNSVTSTTTSGSTAVGGLVGSAQAKTNPTISVNGGQSLSKADLPTKEGYKATWYTDAAMTTPYDFSQPVTSNITLYAKWEEGNDEPDIWDGTSKEPAYDAETKTYTITNGEELAWVSDVTNGVITSGTNFPTDISFRGYTIELANDIYLNDTTNWENWKTTPPKNSWKPIAGLWTKCFSGVLYGNDHRVYGMYVSEYGNYNGFIGQAKNCTIKRLHLKESYIYVDGSKTNNYCVGAIVCKSYENVIYDCSSTGKIVISTKNEGYDIYGGGIVGRSQQSTITNCYNAMVLDINVKYRELFAGGIIGQSNNDTIQNCYNTDSILVVSGSSNCTVTYGSDTHIGGIIGDLDNKSSIKYCYNLANITVRGLDSNVDVYIGGIIGYAPYGGTIVSNCHNRGYITVYGSYYEAYSGGIVGLIYAGDINNSYNVSEVLGGTSKQICGFIAAESPDYYTYLSNCYATASNLYYAEDKYYSIYNVSYKSSSAMKTLSNLIGFSSTYWATNSNINDGYPYLISLAETYKTYKITAVVDTDNSAINRSFANINGNLTGNGSSNANVGGILGSASGSSGANSVAQNVITIADGISSSHKAGNIVADNSGYFTFNNAYYNTEMNITSSSNTIDTTGTARSEISMNVPFYTNLLGLTPYTSLANVANDNKAVWVLENGKLPELYYNCLNDITISDDIENGSVTIDKVQAVDGEVVTVTATPNDGYILNKVYVDGVEQDGTTFVVDGNDEVYVTFAEEISVFDVSIAANENVDGDLVNVDSEARLFMSGSNLSQGADTMITAYDGEEIRVDATPDADYTVDTIYINGEEVTGDSFILTEDTVVTMDVTSISTDVIAITNEAEDVGAYFAVVSGSVSGEDENAVKYIRYWSADDADTVYVTEVENGSGDYTAVLTDLKPETIYYYQMTEFGETKTFTTCEEHIDDEVGGEDGEYDEPENSVLTSSTYTKTQTGYEFIIECSKVLTNELLCVAIYDENKALIDLVFPKPDDGSSYEASFISNKKAQYAKIFIWKGIGNLMPISEAEKLEITK